MVQKLSRALIHPKPSQTQPPEKLAAYLSSNHAAWYWPTVILTAATILIVFTVPEGVCPRVYVRYVLGSIFVFWLTGYAFSARSIKALSPQQLQRAPFFTFFRLFCHHW